MRENATRDGLGKGGWSVDRVRQLMTRQWKTHYSRQYTYKILVKAFGRPWHRALEVRGGRHRSTAAAGKREGRPSSTRPKTRPLARTSDGRR